MDRKIPGFYKAKAANNYAFTSSGQFVLDEPVFRTRHTLFARLEANYSLMLNPGKLSTEQRWQNIMAHLGLEGDAAHIEPQAAIMKLMSDNQLPSSIVSCITSARENASQVREQISSEMWERLNQLYHEVVQTASNMYSDSDVLRLFMALREGGYKFIGVTDSSMNHGEGWHFIQFGKYIERTASLPLLIDALFSAQQGADDLDWVGLLTSCSAFEAYCKVYTADLKPEQVAEFLLLNPEFPYTTRYSTEKMQHALEGIRRTTRLASSPKSSALWAACTPLWPTLRSTTSCLAISSAFWPTSLSNAKACTPPCMKHI